MSRGDEITEQELDAAIARYERSPSNDEARGFIYGVDYEHDRLWQALQPMMDCTVGGDDCREIVERAFNRQMPPYRLKEEGET